MFGGKSPPFSLPCPTLSLGPRKLAPAYLPRLGLAVCDLMLPRWQGAHWGPEVSAVGGGSLSPSSWFLSRGGEGGRRRVGRGGGDARSLAAVMDSRVSPRGDGRPDNDS